MSSRLTPREKRRVDTDDRILKAAMHQFGEKGFTAASLTDIASEAGISQGLVSQRFESKEKLLEAAFKATPAASFFIADVSAAPQQAVTQQATAGSKQAAPQQTAGELVTALLSIVRALKKEQQADRRQFAFIAMLYTSRDLPESFTALSQTLFQKTALPALMKDAQAASASSRAAGSPVTGDACLRFRVFYRNALSVINDCAEAGLPFPADESFLTILGLSGESSSAAGGRSAASEESGTASEKESAAASRTAGADVGVFVEQVKPAFRAVEGYIGLIQKHAGNPFRVRDYAEKAQLIATELVKKLDKLK